MNQNNVVAINEHLRPSKSGGDRWAIRGTCKFCGEPGTRAAMRVENHPDGDDGGLMVWIEKCGRCGLGTMTSWQEWDEARGRAVWKDVRGSVLTSILWDAMV